MPYIGLSMIRVTLFHLLFSSDEEVDEHSTSNIKYPVKSDLQQNDIIQPASDF